MDDKAKLAEERGKRASVEGFSNEHIVCGLLMKKYENVSLVDLPHSPYDIIIVRKMKDDTEDFIRVQVRTASKSVSFTGGSRGGADRTYKSDVKTYVQSPKHSDCIVGINFSEDMKPSLYFFPTVLISQLNQKSIALSKIEKFKDNFEMLEKCKDEKFVIKKAKEYKII